jgi:HSP20 family molecular chaperone IbpA
MRYRGLTDFQDWDRFFDSIFNVSTSFADIARESFLDPIKKLPTAVAQGNFLPSNLYVTDDKAYHIEIAVAGIPKDKISVDWKDDYVSITFDGDTPNAAGKGDAESIETAVTKMESTNVTVSNGKRYIQHNIKEPKGKQTLSYFIDSNYYDGSTLKASMNDGILHVEVKPLKKPEIDTSKKILIE